MDTRCRRSGPLDPDIGPLRMPDSWYHSRTGREGSWLVWKGNNYQKSGIRERWHAEYAFKSIVALAIGFCASGLRKHDYAGNILSSVIRNRKNVKNRSQQFWHSTAEIIILLTARSPTLHLSFAANKTSKENLRGSWWVCYYDDFANIQSPRLQFISYVTCYLKKSLVEIKGCVAVDRHRNF